MEATARHLKLKVNDKPDPQDAAVVLTYQDLIDLGSILGKNIPVKDPLTIKGEVFNAVGKLTTVSVEGVSVTLEPRLLQRLLSRCLDKPHFDRFLREVVIKQLHDYAGY